jgi:hypothetical protein
VGIVGLGVHPVTAGFPDLVVDMGVILVLSVRTEATHDAHGVSGVDGVADGDAAAIEVKELVDVAILVADGDLVVVASDVGDSAADWAVNLYVLLAERGVDIRTLVDMVAAVVTEVPGDLPAVDDGPWVERRGFGLVLLLPRGISRAFGGSGVLGRWKGLGSGGRLCL